MTEDMLRLEQGPVYAAQDGLKRPELIQSEWDVSENDHRARFDKLTRAGQKCPRDEASNWELLSLGIDTIMQVG